jgi:hypothetical protein
MQISQSNAAAFISEHALSEVIYSVQMAVPVSVRRYEWLIAFTDIERN